MVGGCVFLLCGSGIEAWFLGVCKKKKMKNPLKRAFVGHRVHLGVCIYLVECAVFLSYVVLWAGHLVESRPSGRSL